jgi:hypothetical protein
LSSEKALCSQHQIDNVFFFFFFFFFFARHELYAHSLNDHVRMDMGMGARGTWHGPWYEPWFECLFLFSFFLALSESEKLKSVCWCGGASFQVHRDIVRTRTTSPFAGDSHPDEVNDGKERSLCMEGCRAAALFIWQGWRGVCLKS